MFTGRISVYSEICCEECGEIIHNHLDCPVCGVKWAASDNYHNLGDEKPYQLVCECGAVFETKDYPYDSDVVWTQILLTKK